MSSELIGEVTRQAEQQLKQTPVHQAIDGRRWKWALWTIVPVAVLVGLPFLLAPETSRCLVERQLLRSVDIPRSVEIAGTGITVWPTGDEITLQFLARGTGAKHAGDGLTIIRGDRIPSERFALKALKETEEGILYQATIPSPNESFQAFAWLGDGRTKRPAAITLEPRPDLKNSMAWLILPTFVGVRPNGLPYEEPQDRGDIVGFAGCRARIVVSANKPLNKATLQIMKPQGDSPHEEESRTLAMISVDEERGVWGVEFDLRPGESAYRVLMVDDHGYENRKIPRRSITFATNEPPLVQLMPDRFPDPEKDEPGFLEDSEVDGLPVPFEGPIPIGYRVRTLLSLTKAQLRYRILKPGSEGRSETIPWQTLPLTEILETKESGPFNPLEGRFVDGAKKQLNEFAVVGSPAPDVLRGRKEGGGRFEFQTKGLPEVKIGDRIEFFVEAFDSRPGSKPGASDVRVKDIVNGRDFLAWLNAKRDEASRLKQIKDKQTDVFGSGPGSP